MPIARLVPPSPIVRIRRRVAAAIVGVAVGVVLLPALAGALPARAADPPGSGEPSGAPSASATASPSGDPSAPPSPTPSASPSPSPSAPPPPSPSPTATWPTVVAAVPTSVRFYGRGYGHGVGLSQYGARGRALAGQSADQILATYFKGSTRSTVDPARNVRVLVLAGFAASSTSPLTIYGRSGGWTMDGVAATFPSDARLTAWRITATADGATVVSWRYRVTSAAGTSLRSGCAGASLVVRPASSATRLQVWSKPSGYDTYRGRLKVFLGPSTASVVNHVPLDLYLRGVVPVEMPSSWPAQALQAQAIAARSYAVRRLHPSTGSYDLFDDARSQVYHGQEGEASTTTALISARPGVVLMSGSSVVNAFFHSTGGAATENNEYAFVSASGAVTSGPLSYLRGVKDRNAAGAPYDAAAPYFAWTTTLLTRTTLSAMLGSDPRTNVGDLLKLDLTHRGVSGRLYRVTLYGTAGSKTVSADVFRTVYNAARPSGTNPLRSNLFNLAPLP
jgi:stage II sporulation protein D